MGRPFRKGKWWMLRVEGGEGGIPFEVALRERMHISGRKLQKLTRMDGIRLNGEKVSLRKNIREGDLLQVLLFPDEEYGVEPEEMPLFIPYEDEHLLIVDKPAGISVHPTEVGQKGTLANALAYHYFQEGLRTKVRHVHRLDRETSGLLLVAKHALAHSILDEELRERRVKRIYLAIIAGTLPKKEETIHFPIGRDRHHPTRRRVSKTGERAVTHYQVVEEYSQGSLLRLELETGRTHQIRVHLSHLGHPLLGDPLYGGDQRWIRRQALHAHQLSFFHPFLEQEMRFTSPLPQDMESVIRQWREMDGEFKPR
ncbi:Uncharacterized RNA pseudouridine synthase YhcT [[Clostridium] ultunense Esp]|nr:Uncharacterized RNA pseudouridine synthase YhcT [[Clostridium] ultunense Esp]